MLFRVVCGTGLTIETLASQKALSNVDLPAEGRPIMATNADFPIGNGGSFY
jgi:hypothetical protein